MAIDSRLTLVLNPVGSRQTRGTWTAAVDRRLQLILNAIVARRFCASSRAGAADTRMTVGGAATGLASTAETHANPEIVAIDSHLALILNPVAARAHGAWTSAVDGGLALILDPVAARRAGDTRAATVDSGLALILNRIATRRRAFVTRTTAIDSRLGLILNPVAAGAVSADVADGTHGERIGLQLRVCSAG